MTHIFSAANRSKRCPCLLERIATLWTAIARRQPRRTVVLVRRKLWSALSGPRTRPQARTVHVPHQLAQRRAPQVAVTSNTRCPIREVRADQRRSSFLRGSAAGDQRVFGRAPGLPRQAPRMELNKIPSDAPNRIPGVLIDLRAPAGHDAHHRKSRTVSTPRQIDHAMQGSHHRANIRAR